MARATAQSKRPNKPEARQTRNLPNVVRGWRFTSPALVLPLLLLFCALQWLLPLSTAVEIGADEGMELGKTTLWVGGHKLYTEVWNDQPPLHTFLTSQIYKHISHSVLGPRLLTMGFTALLLGSLFTICWRLNGVWVAGVTTFLLIMSPGFLELSSSCMLEIPALAMAVAGLAVLLVGTRSTTFLNSAPSLPSFPSVKTSDAAERLLTEIIVGVLFAAAVLMKLVPVILLSLAALILWVQSREGSYPIKRFIVSSAVLGFAFVASLIAIDFIIDRGLFSSTFSKRGRLISVRRSRSNISAKDHPFDWTILLKNWDATLPALVGLVLLVAGALPMAPAVSPSKLSLS
jgi:4-amino-4-deoxy-L-arabinose transferase-like glycosyltransferase